MSQNIKTVKIRVFFFSGFVNNTALLGLLEVANFENTTLIRTFLKDSLNVHEVQFDFETFT